MFKKLKDKLAEEVKNPIKLPASVQQLSQQNENEQSWRLDPIPEESISISAFSRESLGMNESAKLESSQFCITEEDPNDSHDTQFQNVSLLDIDEPGSSMISTPEPKRNRKSSQGSINSIDRDSLLFGSTYDSNYTPYQFQSDLESITSELSEGTGTYASVSKEQLVHALQRAKSRYHKYKGRYQDLSNYYKESEREREKIKNVLAETQDKALKRISDLKEQCQLEQKAKAHLEENLRADLEEKDHMITVLQSKVHLLQSKSSEVEGSRDSLNDLSSLSASVQVPLDNNSLSPKEQELQGRVKRYEDLLKKCTEKIKGDKEIVEQMKKELETAKNKIAESEQELASIKESRKNELSQLTESLNLAREEIEALRKREETAMLASAETKQQVHEELLKQEEEMQRLKRKLGTTLTEKELLSVKVSYLEKELEQLSQSSLERSNQLSEEMKAAVAKAEEEKKNLIDEFSRGKNEAIKKMKEQLEEELNSDWKNKLSEKLNEKESQFKFEIAKIEEAYAARIRELEESKKLAIEAQEMEYSAKVAQEVEQQNQLKMEISDLNAKIVQLETDKDASKEKWEELRKEWVDQIESNRKRHLEEIDQLKEDHIKQMQTIDKMKESSVGIAVEEVDRKYRRENEDLQQKLDEALELVDNLDSEYRELINKKEREIKRLTQVIVNHEQLFDLFTAALDGKTDLDEKLVKTVNAEEISTLIEDVKGKIQRLYELESVVEITRTEMIHSKQEESKAIERIKELEEDLNSKESQIKEKVNTIDKISDERFVLEQECKELQKQLENLEKQAEVEERLKADERLKSSYEEKVAAHVKAKEKMEKELIQAKDEAAKVPKLQEVNRKIQERLKEKEIILKEISNDKSRLQKELALNYESKMGAFIERQFNEESKQAMSCQIEKLEASVVSLTSSLEDAQKEINSMISDKRSIEIELERMKKEQATTLMEMEDVQLTLTEKEEKEQVMMKDMSCLKEESLRLTALISEGIDKEKLLLEEMQEKEKMMSNIKDRLSVAESELNDAYAKLDNFKNSAEKPERQLKLEVSRMRKSYEEEVAAREKDISDRRNEDAKLEEAKEKLKGFEDLLKNKEFLAEKVLELEKILKNRNEVVESLNNELSESRRRLEENALLLKEFDDKVKKLEKLAEEKEGEIEGLNNTLQSKTTAMTSLSDEIFEKEKQLNAIIADKLIFEKKADDCEKIIEEQCAQLVSLTKELECAKGLAEDTSLRLSEYESKTQELEGILRILKEEHCQKDAELEEASDNLIVANTKNNSLTEVLSEYEFKLKEMKELNLALDDNVSFLKAGKDELNERLKESENNLVTARSDIQNLESQLASLQNDLDSSRTASSILEEMLRSKNLESKSQRDEIEQLKNEVSILKEEKNIIEFELTKTTKVLAEKEEEILRKMQLEKEVKSLYERINKLEAEFLTKTESLLGDIKHLKDTEKILKEEQNVMELDLDKTRKLLIEKEDEKKLLEKEVRSLNERNYDLEADSLISNKIIKERDYRLAEVEAENSALKNSQNSLLEDVKPIKVGKDMLNEPLKESEKDVAVAASDIQNLQIKLEGLQNELDSSRTASNLLEDMIRSKDLEVKSQRDDIDQLKNQVNNLKEEKNVVELELVRTRKLLAEKEDEISKKISVEKEVNSLYEHISELEAEFAEKLKATQDIEQLKNEEHIHSEEMNMINPELRTRSLFVEEGEEMKQFVKGVKSLDESNCEPESESLKNIELQNNRAIEIENEDVDLTNSNKKLLENLERICTSVQGVERLRRIFKILMSRNNKLYEKLCLVEPLLNQYTNKNKRLLDDLEGVQALVQKERDEHINSISDLQKGDSLRDSEIERLNSLVKELRHKIKDFESLKNMVRQLEAQKESYDIIKSKKNTDVESSRHSDLISELECLSDAKSQLERKLALLDVQHREEVEELRKQLTRNHEMVDVALNANGQVVDKTETNKNLRNDVVSVEEVEALKKRHRLEVRELQRLLENFQKHSKGFKTTPLDEAVELEYLKNILYDYMMGKEPMVLAKVLAAVVKFNKDQTRNILEREAKKSSLIGQVVIR